MKPADVVKYKYQAIEEKEVQVDEEHDSSIVLKKEDENKIEIVDVENQLKDEKNTEGK